MIQQQREAVYEKIKSKTLHTLLPSEGLCAMSRINAKVDEHQHPSTLTPHTRYFKFAFGISWAPVFQRGFCAGNYPPYPKLSLSLFFRYMLYYLPAVMVYQKFRDTPRLPKMC